MHSKKNSGLPLLLLFSSCILTSAFLLFWIQPLFTKNVLPILGGAPSVWNTAMVCFQTLLLAGYWYADRLTHIRFPRLQAILHALILCGATLWIWCVPGDIEGITQAAATPVEWLLDTLLFHIGFPFFVLATTSTLLQRWYVNVQPGKEVYWLYIVSNAGSMLGVFGFIIGIEPVLGLSEQALFFKWCFTALMGLLLCVTLAYALHRHAPVTDEKVKVALSKKLYWLILAAVPSSLLLSATTHITMDIAPVPLLWMVLLGLYLISFMLAFSRWNSLSLTFWLKTQMVLCIPLLADFFLDITSSGGLAIMLWHMAAFFVTAVICHRLLYQSRPPAQQLTTFYLYISLGGAVGGMFTTFLAPLLFHSLLEYPLMFMLALALRPAAFSIQWRKDILIGIGVFLALTLSLTLMRPLLHPFRQEAIGLLFMIGIFTVKFCFDQAGRPLRLACCYGAAILSGVVLSDMIGKTLEIERNFYGIITIDASNPDVYSMRHGTTVHGMEYISPEKHLTPLTYFHPSGPLGELMRPWLAQKKTSHVAVIGLGTGSIACYGRKADTFTFFEINPAVIRLAEDTRYFSFLSACPPTIDLVEGDARIKIAEEQRAFDLLIVDAFTSDAIPVHLLTKQAFALYWQHLRPDSVIMVHISNRYLDLARVLAAIADDRHMELKVFFDTDISQERYKKESTWAVMGSPKAISKLALPEHWKPVSNSYPGDLWTDDYSNIFRLLH